MKMKLKVGEEALLESVKLSLDSMHDMTTLSQDGMWKTTETSPDVAPWVRVATARLQKTLFAPFVGTVDDLQVSPFRVGAAMGFLEWGMRSLAQTPSAALRKKLPKVKWSPQARRKVIKMWNDFLIRSGFVTTGEFKVSKYIPKRVERWIDGWRSKSLPDFSEFNRGYALGLRGLGKDAPGDKSDLASDVYFALVTWWRIVARFKSVTELHAWLIRIMGAQKVGDRKRVEKLCERIGLKLRKRGRPKNPTLALPG